MAKKLDAKTPDLFEIETPVAYPASMDYRKEVSYLFAEIVKDYKGDRFKLAAEMSRLTGIEISKQMIDGYTAEGRKNFNIPFWLVAAAEVAADSYKFTNWLVTKRQGRVFWGEDVIKAKIGAAAIKKKKAEEELKGLQELLS